MVVEDNEDIREAMAEFLLSYGYQVIEAENGKHALELLDEVDEKPCLLLLDLMMPVMSGGELLQVLESSGRLALYPVIVISAGNYKASDFPQAIKFVRKPPDYKQLLECVQQICPTEPVAPS